MESAASVDISDVLLYEANTEGSNNYTAYHLNRGYIKDKGTGISAGTGTPYSATISNRIRGLSAADASRNNYPAIARIPFDSCNTQTVEIDHGPNSMLFGTGSPSGILNQNTVNGLVNVNRSSVTGRIGSLGALRSSFTRRQSLVEDKLAVYVVPCYTKGLIDSSLYDWEHINISASNFQSSEAKTCNLELSHVFNEDFSVQLGWFKQDLDSLENNTIANACPAEVLVDVNMYRLDGSTALCASTTRC